MKIFYFTNTKLPSNLAQSVHVMKMAQALAVGGHDVTLFAKNIGGANADDIFKVYDTKPCFDLKLSSPWPIPVLSRMKLLRDVASSSSKPDLIYGHDPVSLSLFTRDQLPIIFEAHRLPNSAADVAAFKRLFNSNTLKSIICVSDVLKQEFLRKFPQLDGQHIFVAHDGADLIENLSARAKQEVSLKGGAYDFHVGYAGALHPGKGLAMIDRLAALRPNYGFHVLGGIAKAVQKLQTNNTNKNVHFYGHRDHADVPAFLRAFDVCIAPYQHRALIKTGRNTSRWISPMKVFEYMAVKKPIIASNLSVIQEILQHEHSAFLLPASHQEKWAETLDILKEHPEIGDQMAQNAHDSLRDKYTWTKRAQAIMEFSGQSHQQVRFADKLGHANAANS